MRVCASYGSVPDRPADADMHEIRLDVFKEVPSWASDDCIITLAGKDVSSVPAGFGGLVDAGDSDAPIPFRRIRSVHDFGKTPSAEEIRRSLETGDQELSKFACAVHSFTDLHSIYAAASAVKRKHLVLGMGETGTVTRIRQSLLGNGFTFGYVGERTAPGQLSAEEMEALGDGCAVVGITGNPLGHTKSPAMHNAAMADRGINGIYLKFETPDLAHMDDVMREYGIRGMNVTIPYKQEVIPLLDGTDGPAERIGAVNTVVNDGGKLTGTNTDYAGVLYAFERAGKKLSDCDKVLIYGSGGAARAAVYAAQESGCRVAVMGRTPENVSSLCRDTGAEAARDTSVSGYDALINCTPVGMKEDSDYMFDLSEIGKDTAVLDMVYNRKTRLVERAESAGCITASGKDMLIGQGALSFEKWFGVRPDTEIMRRAAQ